jgi:hypothetical protein
MASRFPPRSDHALTARNVSNIGKSSNKSARNRRVPAQCLTSLHRTNKNPGLAAGIFREKRISSDSKKTDQRE